MRANYVALMFRKANRLILNLEDPSNNGWDERGRVMWGNAFYPDDISQLLINHAEDKEKIAYMILALKMILMMSWKHKRNKDYCL